MLKSEVAELVAILSAAFTRPQMTQDTMNVYVSMLEDLDHEPAKKAVARLIATSKWLPSVADIRTAAIEMKHGARRLGMAAWGDVIEAQRLVGFIPKFIPDREKPVPPRPKFEDPLVAQCVETMGGWMKFRSTDTSDRARFVELYDGLAEQARRELVAGSALALPEAKGGARRALQGVPGVAAIGNGGKSAGGTKR